MKSLYSIEDVLLQTSQLIVYRVVGQDGHSLALTRLLFNEREQGQLAAGGFENALEALKQLDHSCLRRALDGGLDEVDGAPWIVTQLWEGDSVKDRYEAGNFNYEGKSRLEAQARNLMESLGGYAGALSFNPVEVIDTKASDGSIVETFSMDFREWLLGWIRSDEVLFERNPELGLARLLGALPVTTPAIAPAVMQPVSTVASLSPQVPLSSASSGSPVGLIAILTLLAAGIGGGAWWAMKDKGGDSEVAIVNEVEEEQKPVFEKKMPAQVKEKSSQPKPAKKEPEMVTAVEPKQAAVSEPEEDPDSEFPSSSKRPDMGEMVELNASDLEKVSQSVGRWVIMRGKISSFSKDDDWVLESAGEDQPPIQVNFRGAKNEEVLGKSVEMIGYLESEKSLQLYKEGDFEILDEVDLIEIEGRVFTIEDEADVRLLTGASISFQAEVLKFHESKATFYLEFTDGNEKLAARSYKQAVEGKITKEFFESLVGKIITVKGRVFGVNRFGGRFEIVVEELDQIKVE